jgi:hypothetical protein
MELERTIEMKSSKNNIKAEIKVEVEHSVVDKILNADGIKINAGRELHDEIWIKMYVNGKLIAMRNEPPKPVNDPDLIAKGAYAVIEWRTAYLNEDNYKKVMQAIVEMEQEIANNQTDEYKEMAQAEADRIARREAYEASDAYKKEQEMWEAHERLMRAMDDPNSDY